MTAKTFNSNRKRYALGGVQASPGETLQFTGKEWDEETRLYYMSARYQNPMTSRWISVDPAGPALVNPNQKGFSIIQSMNWYSYTSNNPVNYIDPTGMSELTDDLQNQITEAQAQFRDIFMGPDYDSPESGEKLGVLKDQILDLMGQYNQAVIDEGNLDITDYITNGVQTGGFGDNQGLTGDYQTTAHPGIDGVGGSAKTPFYTQMTNADEGRSNTMTLSIIGTNLNMQISHGDKGSWSRISGGLYKPGQAIMPFPMKNNNDVSSTAPHFHFQIANGTNFVNPYTMRASDTVFKFTNNGGSSWRNFRTDF
ncbi:RHS repeat-associated core domain-containing protein [Spirochaeta isovalerica]|uniref:RHS repeat-associated protein n=1 Tax=Spirochaeta isovalerica TaxID=150 RepID=A0A841RB09_9SPIO|nr:RHS repeat-associated protein [Spirochaeta isovalerica]